MGTVPRTYRDSEISASLNALIPATRKGSGAATAVSNKSEVALLVPGGETRRILKMRKEFTTRVQRIERILVNTCHVEDQLLRILKRNPKPEGELRQSILGMLEKVREAIHFLQWELMILGLSVAAAQYSRERDMKYPPIAQRPRLRMEMAEI